jgi:hypoxanthine phosphoribosyltransferase
MNSTYTKIAAKNDVQIAIKQIATTIIYDYPTTPLFVSLLRGAAPFSSKLMHQIAEIVEEYHPELDYMMVSTYGDSRTAGEPRIVTDVSPTTEIAGRTVIVIDDVLDKGITADFVAHHLKYKGAAEIKLAVLCDKTTNRTRDIQADYVGFTVPDGWLIGMGMDNASEAKEAYRWLEEIWDATSVH